MILLKYSLFSLFVIRVLFVTLDYVGILLFKYLDKFVSLTLSDLCNLLVHLSIDQISLCHGAGSGVRRPSVNFPHFEFLLKNC